MLAETGPALRILFPPPGTTFYLDADLPHHGGRVAVQADGPGSVQWRSDSLRFEAEGARTVALLTEGCHEISVTDPRSGAQARTWIEVIER